VGWQCETRDILRLVGSVRRGETFSVSAGDFQGRDTTWIVMIQGAENYRQAFMNNVALKHLQTSLS
jgi:hypothetical protein